MAEIFGAYRREFTNNEDIFYVQNINKKNPMIHNEIIIKQRFANAVEYNIAQKFGTTVNELTAMSEYTFEYTDSSASAADAK